MEQKDMLDKELKVMISSKVEKPSNEFSVAVMREIEYLQTPKKRIELPILFPVVVFIGALIFAFTGSNGESGLNAVFFQLNDKMGALHISSVMIYALICLTVLLLIQVPIINRWRSK